MSATSSTDKSNRPNFDKAISVTKSITKNKDSNKKDKGGRPNAVEAHRKKTSQIKRADQIALANIRDRNNEIINIGPMDQLDPDQKRLVERKRHSLQSTKSKAISDFKISAYCHLV